MEVGYDEPGNEEEEFPDGYIQMINEGSDEEEANSIDQENQESIDISSDLAMQLASLSFPEIESSFDNKTIENLFNSLDTYEALLQSIDWIKKTHPEGNLEKIPESTKQLLISIIKQIAHIQDIKPLLKQAIDEGNNLIIAIIICSLDTDFNDNFYDKFVYLYLGIRSIGGENKPVFVSLTNIPDKLWLPILRLQLEIGYPLLPMPDLVLNAFVMGKKELIIYMIINNIIPVHPIFKAALLGDIEYLQQTEFDVNALDPSSGLSLLGFTAIGDQTEIAEKLINNGANVEAGNSLHVAAFFGSLPIVELLLKANANINAKCPLKFFKDCRPIDGAIIGRYQEIARLLFDAELNSGIQPINKDQQMTFEYALSYEDKNLAETLLTSYPQCFTTAYLSESPYPNGVTPLHLTAQFNWKRLALLLINAGVNLNNRSVKYFHTALHIAAIQGHHNLIKLLLDSGAQIGKNCQDLTELDLAKLTFIFAKTKKDRANAVKAFQYLYDAQKEKFDHFEPEDFPTHPQLNKKRRLTSLTLRSSSNKENKKQKMKLTKKLQPKEEVEPLAQEKN